jgi:hypothetical protein
MAIVIQPNPLPISGSVSITGTPTVNIGNEPIEVTVNATVVEDTSRYFNDDMTLSSDTTIESNLDIGTVIEILNVNIACTDSNLFKIAVKSAPGVSDADVICIFYCIGSINVTPNIRFTVPDHSSDNIELNVRRLSGAGSADVAVSLIYRITAP